MEEQKERRFSSTFEDKAYGWIFLNGNVRKEEDLVNMCKDQIQNPQTFKEELNKSKKVLLVTAAFQKGEEHHDRHLIESFEKIGIDAGWNNGMPQNIQNLSVWTMFNTFKEKEPWLYRKYTEKQDQIKAFKQDYFIKNSRYMEMAHEITKGLNDKYPNLNMFEFYNIEKYKEDKNFFTENYDFIKGEDILREIDSLCKNQKDLDSCKELIAIIDHIIFKDAEMFDTCKFIENYFLEHSKIASCSLYNEQREDLKKRILSSATVFFYGGRVYVLVNRLRFYQLAEYFKEALQNGTNTYGISAGTLCQQDKFFLNLDRFTPGGYLRASDMGMGLTSGLWVTPHAEDYNYIREADKDTLSFFSLRQVNGVVVGLSANSILLCERYKDPIDQKIYKRYTSIGNEPVLIFGIRGIKYEMKKYSQIIIEGTKFYNGKPMIGEKEDIEELERTRIGA